MKERKIRIMILSAVFVLAMVVFSILMNRKSADMTADMELATLPTLSFQIAGKEANHLVGHRREMNLAAVRDVIAVYGESDKLEMRISHETERVDSVSYEIYTIDGKEKLYQERIDKVKKTMRLKMSEKLQDNEEGVIKITLHCEKKPIYYYMRIVKDQDFHLEDCVNYMEELHTNILKRQNEDMVKKVMESNAQGDNTTLQHVTIHSDLNHIMWGKLKPKVTGEVRLEIKEAKKAYISALLNYQVVCEGDNNKEERYYVKEFFKLANGEERVYLLEYDRKLEEIFDTSNQVLNSKGVLLGIAEEQTPYKVNRDGTVVAFVQANELWNYNREKDAFSMIFSFAFSEKQDERYLTDDHLIQILSIEDDGNMTFSVSGYMNRGRHEGESGIAIYYYYADENYTEEIVFIPSTESYAVMEQTVGESAYYNQEQDVLYMLSDGTLRKITMKDMDSTVLVGGLKNGQYVASDDGHLFAYQKTVSENVVTEVWDFAKDRQTEVDASEGEVIVPLGFVGNDFVYGVSKTEAAGVDASGEEVQAMHRVEIRNQKNKVIKTYEQPELYVLRATVANNMVSLKQGVREGGIYREVSENYITNNETSFEGGVSLKAYRTDLKETQYLLSFEERIKDTKAKSLRPKQMMKETADILKLEGNTEKRYYYVYGLGEQAGAFEDAGAAIRVAETTSGVVISPQQNYLWEADNRTAWYRNFNVSAFSAQAGDTNLTACVRKVLAYEGKSPDVATELADKTPEQLLGDQLATEAVRFRGVSVKDMFYLIDKGVPVIGLKDSENAILFVGYDAKTATYIDPTNGGTYASSIEKVDEMLRGSGNTFIGYAR